MIKSISFRQLNFNISSDFKGAQCDKRLHQRIRELKSSDSLDSIIAIPPEDYQIFIADFACRNCCW
jgi:hypothetical protein